MTDFKTWARETLEQFAREAADENRELKEKLKGLLDAWRQEVIKNSKEQSK